MREVKLPSGATLRVTSAPFADSKRLYQAILREVQGVEINSKLEMASVLKNLFCIGFASLEIESALSKCFERCTYNDLKIDNETFEPVESRQDYMQVCIEVGMENINPFVKSLYAEFSKAMEMMEDSHA